MDVKLNFYDDFKCTADKCPMTCCMQWKIGVDDKTYATWKKTDYLYKKLSDYTMKKDGARVVKLNDNGECPFLDENKLCKLVVEHGEGILSHTCDIFPRQVHEFETHKEYTLVSCCPEVVNFLNDKEIKVRFNDCEMPMNREFALRKLALDIVANEEYGVEESILTIYYILLEMYNQDLDEFTDFALIDEIYDTISAMDCNEEEMLCEDFELWLDMVENYRKEKLYETHIEPVSLKVEEMLENGDFEEVKTTFNLWKKQWKKYEYLLRNYLLLEIYSNMLIPGGDLLSMVIKLQWIAMEYSLIRTYAFVKYLETNNLEYNELRDIIVVVSRMTGYDEEDIYEYMERSFNELVWEWGYMLLLLGNNRRNA